jgi:L-amino acid N-acyltransferase YncA
MPVTDPLTIRPATTGDLAAVVAIYNAGIAERVATFETNPRTEADLASWTTDGQPFVVAEQTDQVVGFGRAGSYSDRCVYQGVGEHAVYVRPDARRQGLGQQLLEALCAGTRSSADCCSRSATDRDSSSSVVTP